MQGGIQDQHGWVMSGLFSGFTSVCTFRTGELHHHLYLSVLVTLTHISVAVILSNSALKRSGRFTLPLTVISMILQTLPAYSGGNLIVYTFIPTFAETLLG